MSTEKFDISPAGLTWFKSSYSDSEGANCVEIAASPNCVHVRDSKDRAGRSLAFSRDAWASFVAFAAEQPDR